MAPDVVLRPALEDDVDPILAINLRARGAAPMPDAPCPPAELRRLLAERVRAGDVLVAAASGDVLAYATVSGAWLDDLYVMPGHQRQGLGSLLLEVVKAQQPQGFGLWVFESNQPAREFYARHGLVELERTDGSANEEEAPDIRVVWPGTEPMAYYRGSIDEIDVRLGDLLARRAALTRAVQLHKRGALAGADPGRDQEREDAIVARVLSRVPELGADRVRRIMHAIITESIGACS